MSSYTRWSKIASHFPGRTDNEIKNVWNTHLKKKLLSLKGADRDDSRSSCMMSSSSSSSISGKKQIDHAEKDCSNKLQEHNTDQTPSPINFEDLFDDQSEDYIFEEVNKPEMITMSPINIPFESENNDFWNLLDNIGSSSLEFSSYNHDQEINQFLTEIDGCAEDECANVGYDQPDIIKNDNENESSKWFKYLETELGLEETTN